MKKEDKNDLESFVSNVKIPSEQDKSIIQPVNSKPDGNDPD